jgi:hypothetical protein
VPYKDLAVITQALKPARLKTTPHLAGRNGIGFQFLCLFVVSAKESESSVLTAGKQCGEDAQIRIGEEPAFRLPSDGSGSAYNGAQMFAAGDGAEMFGADSRQVGNFIFGENLLMRLNSDHSRHPSLLAGPSCVFRN